MLIITYKQRSLPYLYAETCYRNILSRYNYYML